MSNKFKATALFLFAIINFLIFSYDIQNDRDYWTWLWLLISQVSFLASLRFWVKHDREVNHTKKQNEITTKTSESQQDNNVDTCLSDSFRGCVNDGVVLGLKDGFKSLNHFLDRKVEMGYPEYISRKELRIFLEQYIKDVEEGLQKSLITNKSKTEHMETIVEKLDKYFEETPPEKVLEDWEKTKEFDDVGITVEEFLKGTNDRFGTSK